MLEYTMVGNYCNCLKIHVDKGHARVSDAEEQWQVVQW